MTKAIRLPRRSSHSHKYPKARQIQRMVRLLHGDARCFCWSTLLSSSVVLVPTEYLLLCSFSFYREVLWLRHILGHDGANNMLMTSSLLYHIHTWEILDHSKGVFLAFSLVFFSWLWLWVLDMDGLGLVPGFIWCCFCCGIYLSLPIIFGCSCHSLLISLVCRVSSVVSLPIRVFSFSFLRFLCVIDIEPAFNKTFYFHFHKSFLVG